MKKLGFVISVLLCMGTALLMGCTSFSEKETGSVTFSLSPELASAVLTSNRVALADEVSEGDGAVPTEEFENFQLVVELSGDYNDSKTIEISQMEWEKIIHGQSQETVSFDEIPVGSRITVTVKISRKSEDSLRLIMKGSSVSTIIHEGENQIAVKLHPVKDDEDPENPEEPTSSYDGTITITGDSGISFEITPDEYLYRNFGAIHFDATSDYAVVIDSVKLLYGGVEIESDYYSVDIAEKKITFGSASEILPFGGTYQLYITAKATLNGSETSLVTTAMANIFVNDAEYFIFDITGVEADTTTKKIYEAMRNLSSKAVIKITGFATTESLDYASFNTAIASNGVYGVELDLSGLLSSDSSLLNIDENSGFKTQKLVNTLICPTGLTSIGENSFKSSNIENISIQKNSELVIAEGAFAQSPIEKFELTGEATDCAYFTSEDGKLLFREVSDGAGGAETHILAGAHTWSTLELTNEALGVEVSAIDASAFYNASIVNLVLGESITSLGDRAFYSIKTATVTLNSIPNCENYALSAYLTSDYGITPSMTINFAITEANSDSFKSLTQDLNGAYEVTFNEEVYLPDASAPSDNYSTSSDCCLKSYSYSLKKLVFNKKAEIGKYQFTKFERLAEVEFNCETDESTIGDYAFKKTGTDSYASDGKLTLKNIASIGTCAFDGCYRLSSELDLTGVKEIKDSAFRLCKIPKVTMSTDITLNGMPFISYEGGYVSEALSYNQISEWNIVGTPSGSTYYASALDGKILLKVDGSVTSIIDAACDVGGTEKALDLSTLDESVTVIESYAFDRCDLTSITSFGPVKELEKYAFWASVGNLTSVNLSGVKHIGQQAFYNCQNLESLTWSDSILSIGDTAFYSIKCTAISLPASVIAIAADAFQKYGSSAATLTIGGVGANDDATVQPTNWYKANINTDPDDNTITYSKKTTWEKWVNGEANPTTEGALGTLLPVDGSTETVIKTIQDSVCSTTTGSTSTSTGEYFYRYPN